MIDNDTEYLALKKQCNNGLYQFSQPSGYDKSKWKYALRRISSLKEA